MPIFGNSDEEDRGRVRNKALGATALGAGALFADYPASKAIDYLNKYIEATSGERTQVLDAKIRSDLVDTLLDKNLRNMPVVIDPSTQESSFVLANKNFAPDRKVALDAVESGGVLLAGGERSPMSKFIKDTRNSGGYIALSPKNQTIHALAHELGHATSLMEGSPIRSSSLFSNLDNLGRKALKNAPLVGGAAALAAMSSDPEGNAKWVAPGAILATQLPVLYEEGMASYKGLEALKKLNAKNIVDAATKVETPVISKETLELAKKALRGSYGTYAAGAAGLLAAPLLAMKARSLIDSITDE